MLLTLRYYTRLTLAFISRFKILILFGIFIGIGVFFGATSIINARLLKSNEIIGVSGRYYLDNLPIDILEEIGDGLTSIDTNGTVSPNLAESWETPDAGKTWVFTLKEGLVWQDNSLVSSDTINYEFSDTTIERPSENTIVFKLEEEYTPFPSIVSKPTFRKGLLGTGEWVVKDITLSNNYTKEIYLESSKKDKKIYRFYPTEEAAKTAFQLGEVDKLINIVNSDPLDKWQTNNIQKKVNKSSIVTLFFNTDTQTGSVVAEKAVRQALTYAIDKDSFDGERAFSPVHPDYWAYNPLVKKYDFDPDRAKELLKDTPKEEKEKPLRFVTSPVLLNEAEKIADYWRQLGFNVVIQVSSIVPTEFDAFLTIFDPPIDPDQYSFWHSTQSVTNISRYKNPRIDKLLEDGRKEINQETRRTLYLDFQRFLLEDSPAAFLYHPYTYIIERK